MALRIPSLPKHGRREDDDNESRRRKKLEKGKEPATKDADEELFFDDTKFAVDLLRSTFRKLEDVGVALDIKAHHDVLLTVYIRIKLHMDLQADKSPVVVKEPFFP
jgi:hypothetical protein